MFTVLLFALYGFGLTSSTLLPDTIRTFYNRWEVGLLSVLSFIAGAWVIYPFFSGRTRQTTLINKSDIGEVDITIDALDHLVKGIAVKQDGVIEIDTSLKAGEDGLHIFLTGKVLPNIPLPDMVKELQTIVKSYIEEITGVTVARVKVRIDGIDDGKRSKVE